jgi:hypothetical protein
MEKITKQDHKKVRCKMCYKIKYFNKSPPNEWSIQNNYLYPDFVKDAIYTLLLVRKRLFSFPKDPFLLILKYVAKAYTQDILKDFNELCDDCIFIITQSPKCSLCHLYKTKLQKTQANYARKCYKFIINITEKELTEWYYTNEKLQYSPLVIKKNKIIKINDFNIIPHNSGLILNYENYYICATVTNRREYTCTYCNENKAYACTKCDNRIITIKIPKGNKFISRSIMDIRCSKCIHKYRCSNCNMPTVLLKQEEAHLFNIKNRFEYNTKNIIKLSKSLGLLCNICKNVFIFCSLCEDKLNHHCTFLLGALRAPNKKG